MEEEERARMEKDRDDTVAMMEERAMMEDRASMVEDNRAIMEERSMMEDRARMEEEGRRGERDGEGPITFGEWMDHKLEEYKGVEVLWNSKQRKLLIKRIESVRELMV